MKQLKQLVDNWVVIAQGVIGSVGALCFANVKSPCTDGDRQLVARGTGPSGHLRRSLR
jgi:hypothetical protein